MDKDRKIPTLKPTRSSFIQPGSGRRLRGSLAQQLAVSILSGELPEGHIFPGEIEYSEQIGISRSALREAFRTLAAKGLVDSRSEEHTSELQSLMRISYAVFCLKKKKHTRTSDHSSDQIHNDEVK